MNLNPLSWFRNEATYSIGDDAVLNAFYGALNSVASSGIRVTRETALRSTAVLACLIVRAETHSALPVNVYRKAGRWRLDAAGDAPDATRLLTIAPNDLMTAGEFWRWEDMREDIHGNAYARIVWKGYNPVELWPLTGAEPNFTWDKQTRQGVFNYSGDDFTPSDVYPARDILHFKSAVITSGNANMTGGAPFKGRSLIELASESIGVSIGSEQFFARLLSNGAHFPGWLESEQPLTEEKIKEMTNRMRGFGGIIQAGVMRIFSHGLKYHSNPMSIKDADLTAQMRWQLQQICSILRVPLPMVQELSFNTYTNAEQADLWLGKHTITPMCVNKERVIKQRLFARTPEMFMKFNLDGLLRGDYKTRMEGDAAAINSGFLTRNEARAWENLNPVAGLDMPTLNLGYGTVGPDGIVTSATKPAAPAAVALQPVLKDALACIKRRVESDRDRGVAYDRTLAFATEKLAPVIEAYALAGHEIEAADLIDQALNEPAEVTA